MENKAIFLQLVSIKYCVAFTAESKSSTITLSHFNSEAILSNKTTGVPSRNTLYICVKLFSFCVSSAKAKIKPSIAPLSNISSICFSFSKDSLEVHVIKL